MRTLWALVAVVCGAIGALSILRGIEVAIVRGPGTISPLGTAFGLAMLYAAWRCPSHSAFSGEVIEPKWTRFTFPTMWHYDVLRGLDDLR